MPDRSQHQIADAYLASVLPFLHRAGGIWPKAVVFDLDGTLADTAEDLATALNTGLAEVGIEPFPVDQVRLMVGGGLKALMERALKARDAELGEAEREALVARLYELYAANPVEKSRTYEGAEAMLQTLGEAGIVCGVCTNKPQSIAEDVLEGLQIAHRFAFIQGGDTDLPKKPDPAPLVHVMQKLGAKPSQTVMVGDSTADVGAARAAELAGIVLVSHGYSKLPPSEMGGDVIIDSLPELPRSLAVLARRTRTRR
ncbi:Phosphoglycolate phosphatase [Methyloligella halotolerans]|uniref:phosphoglycolate phosphatase n=1 Tax=Methyloligella halotolerans TaxID=1177755 RepID=A0A1E2S3L1_9HYPH|nr:HAD-IA family hydrolase [Methyloligella halotolerans]ODA68925.1 Phosphoglycolate phosphatase [Methyloligella halotolerans]